MLLAEDEEIQRTVFTRVLEDAGFVVDAVADGDSACARLKSARYDLLILDHTIPKRTGAEILVDVRTRDRELPVIVVSGYGVHPDFLEAVAGTRTRVLGKPIAGAELLDAVNDMLVGNSSAD